MRDRDPRACPSSHFDRLGVRRRAADLVVALVGCVQATEPGDLLAQRHELVGRGGRRGLVVESRGEAQRSGVHPGVCGAAHSEDLVVGRTACVPAQHPEADRLVRRHCGHVQRQTAKAVEVCSRSGPARPGIGITVRERGRSPEGRRGIVRQSGPAKSVRTREVRRDALEQRSEAIGVTAKCRLGMDVRIDEARSYRTLLGGDFERRPSVRQDTHRHDPFAADPYVGSPRRRCGRSVDDETAANDEVEVHDSRQ